MSDGIALGPPPPGDEEEKRQLATALRITAEEQSQPASRTATAGEAQPTKAAAGEAGANQQRGVRGLVTETGNDVCPRKKATADGGRAREVTLANVQTLQATASEAEASSAADACAEAPAPVGAAVGPETSAPAGDEVRLKAAEQVLPEPAPALSEAGNGNSPQGAARALPKVAATASLSSKPPGTQSDLRLTPEEELQSRSGRASVSPVSSALPTPNDGGNEPKNTTRTSERRRMQTERYSPPEPPRRHAGGTKTSLIDGAWPLSGARAAKGDSKKSNAARCAIGRLLQKHEDSTGPQFKQCDNARCRQWRLFLQECDPKSPFRCWMIPELAHAGAEACKYGPRPEDEEWMDTRCFESADPNEGYSEDEFCDNAFIEFAIQVMVDKLEHKRLMRDDKCISHVIDMQRKMLQRKRQDAPSSERIDGFRSILSYILNNAILVSEDYGADPDTIANDLQKVSTARDMYHIGWQLEESIDWKHVVERPNSRNARISGGARTGQRAHTERRRGRGPVSAAQVQASTTPSTTESSDEGCSGGSSPALQNQQTSCEDTHMSAGAGKAEEGGGSDQRMTQPSAATGSETPVAAGNSASAASAGPQEASGGAASAAAARAGTHHPQAHLSLHQQTPGEHARVSVGSDEAKDKDGAGGGQGVEQPFKASSALGQQPSASGGKYQGCGNSVSKGKCICVSSGTVGQCATEGGPANEGQTGAALGGVGAGVDGVGAAVSQRTMVNGGSGDIDRGGRHGNEKKQTDGEGEKGGEGGGGGGGQKRGGSSGNVVDDDGQELITLHFRVPSRLWLEKEMLTRPDAPLEAVMKTYRNDVRFARDAVRFEYNGLELLEKDTPRMKQMPDGAEIIVKEKRFEGAFKMFEDSMCSTFEGVAAHAIRLTSELQKVQPPLGPETIPSIMLQPLKDAIRKHAKKGRDEGAGDLEIRREIEGAIKNLNAKRNSTGLDEIDAEDYAGKILRDIARESRDPNLGSSNGAAQANNNVISISSDDEASEAPAPCGSQGGGGSGSGGVASGGSGAGGAAGREIAGLARGNAADGVGEVPKYHCGRCGQKTKIAKTSPCSNPACQPNLQRDKNHNEAFKCSACKQSFKMKKGLTVHKAMWCRYRADLKYQGRGSKPWERGANAMQASRKRKRTPVEKVSRDGDVQSFDSVLNAARHLAEQESLRNPNFTIEMTRSKIRKSLSDNEKLEDGSFYRYTDRQEGQGSAPAASQGRRAAGGAGGGAARGVAHRDDAGGSQQPRGRDEEMVDSECGSGSGQRKRTPTDRFKFSKNT